MQGICKATTLEEAIPEVERRLRLYFDLQRDTPAPAPSLVYGECPIRPEGYRLSTPVEYWACRHVDNTRDAQVIESVMKRLSERERRLVVYRYDEGWPWRQIAKVLDMSVASAYDLRDRVAYAFAIAFDLLTLE